MGYCSHLGIEEREDVMLLAGQHKGVREIARTIGRGRIAIAHELSERPPEASARARQIQERLGITACFCAPRHPWEKGTNENTNGLLRGFFPKGRSLDGAADTEVNAAYAHAQPQTAQAPRLEVPTGGLLLTGVALALKFRPSNMLDCAAFYVSFLWRLTSMIRELRVSGFRILKDFVWEPKEGLNILVGANSAGKSTVLDAIELVTRGSIRGQSSRRSLSPDWFNKDIVDSFFRDLDDPTTNPHVPEIKRGFGSLCDKGLA